MNGNLIIPFVLGVLRLANKSQSTSRSGVPAESVTCIKWKSSGEVRGLMVIVM